MLWTPLASCQHFQHHSNAKPKLPLDTSSPCVSLSIILTLLDQWILRYWIKCVSQFSPTSVVLNCHPGIHLASHHIQQHWIHCNQGPVRHVIPNRVPVCRQKMELNSVFLLAPPTCAMSTTPSWSESRHTCCPNPSQCATPHTQLEFNRSTSAIVTLQVSIWIMEEALQDP